MSDHYREPAEILTDESFLSWYFKTGDGKEQAWEQWMREHPEGAERAQEAILLLEAMRVSEPSVSVVQLRAAEARLTEGIDRLDAGVLRRSPVRPMLRWMAVAAVLLAVIAGVWLVRGRGGSDRPELQASFGQVLNRQLPDGTEVTMNANSRLSYLPGWADGKDREVWVSGEAFFHVRRTAQKSRFIVHSEHFDIIVTGTRFNVVNRHGKDNVLLEEGSVTLQMKDGRTLYMKPGDFIAFDSLEPAKRSYRVDSALAWKEQKLVLDRTPLRELAGIIHDHYGVNLRMADDATGERLISAILPNNNLDVLLQALEATGDFSVERQGEDVLIKARRQEP